MGHWQRDLTEMRATEITAAADVALTAVLDAPSRGGRVVAVTSAAVYADLDGEVVALLGPAAARVPGGLVVGDAWADVAARVPDGGPVLVGGGGVTVGGVRIRPLRWYDSRVPRVAVTAPPPSAAKLDLPPLPDVVGAAAAAFAAALGPGGTGAPGLAGAVGALVGLGPGLTPAGDDVLAGALVALAATGGDAARLARLVAPLLPRTTIVSAAMLGWAATGRAVPQLGRVVVAAAAGRLAPPMVQDLLQVGSSSGTALAYGALAALGAPALEVA